MSANAVRHDRATKAAIVAASLAAHGLMLALLSLVRPTLPETRISEPEAIDLQLWTAPRTERETRASRARPASPSPLQPRQVSPLAPPSPIAPLPLAPALSPGSARPPGGFGVGEHPGPLPAQARGDLKRALRGSTVGCANRDTVGLTRREREACDEAFGRGAADARFIEPPMDPAKRRAYDAVAARKAAERREREAPLTSAADPTNNAGGTSTTGIGLSPY